MGHFLKTPFFGTCTEIGLVGAAAGLAPLRIAVLRGWAVFVVRVCETCGKVISAGLIF